MQTTQGIDPMTVRLADLDVMESQPHGMTIIQPDRARALPRVTKRDARQRFLGAMKMINWLCGGEMQHEMDSMEFLVSRIDQLEAEAAEREAYILAKEESFETEKSSYQRQIAGEIAGYKKALRNIAAALGPYCNPFDALPYSKWKSPAKGLWMTAAAESIQWAVQRADNQLDPVNAVPIAPDEV